MTDTTFQPLPTATPSPLDGAEGTDEHEQPAGTDDRYVELNEADEAKPKGRPRPGRSTHVTARTVRTIRAKVQELEAAPASALELLAAALGTRNDVDEVVAHITSTSRVVLAGFAELESIVEAAADDPFDAMAKAMQHEQHAKTLWGILTSLRLVDGGRPAKDTETAVAIARAAATFTAAHATQLATVRDLARKAS